MAEFNENIQNNWTHFETHLYIYISDIIIDIGTKLRINLHSSDVDCAEVKLIPVTSMCTC